MVRGRMRYGKLWAEKYLNTEPDRIHSQPENVRCLWLEFFVRDIDSPWPGWIQVSPRMGYSDEQLADMANMASLSYAEAKTQLAKIGEIAVHAGNRIQWVRHKETQSEYLRKLDYLARKQQGTEKGTPEGTLKGTPECPHIIENREDRIENREDRIEKKAVKTPPCPQVQALVDLWHSTCPALPRITDVESLRDKARLRLKEHPDPEWWRMVFQKCLASPFLREKPSVGNLRWLTINKANAVKVYEGNYDKREFAGQQAWLARKVAERGEKQ